MSFTYKGLSAQLSKHTVTEDEVNRQLHRLQQQTADQDDQGDIARASRHLCVHVLEQTYVHLRSQHKYRCIAAEHTYYIR